MRTRVIAAALLLASGTAGAWVARPDGEPAEVPAGALRTRADRTLMTARDLPAGWQGARDRETGVVAELWGGYVSVPGAVADPVVAEAAAAAFLAERIVLLAPGARADDFVVVANHLDRGVRTIGFAQLHRGARVVGGQIAIFIKRDRVFAAQSQALPNITVAVPARTSAVDSRRARDWIGGSVVTRTVGPRVVLPLDGGYRVADQLEIEATDRTGRWDVYVGLDGAPLLRASQLRFATGTLAYDVGERYPLGTRRDVPARQVGVVADGVAGTTASDGTFSWAGAAAATVEPGLVGSTVAIENAAGPLATASLVAQPSGTVRWSLATDEYGDAQLSSFVHVGVAQQRARVLLPSLAPWLDQPLPVTVNENDICNAFSTGNDIHFYRRGPSCENTGRLADVISHEFGHSLHKHAIIPGSGAFNSALSEGVSDFFAATIAGEAAIGRGFAFDNTATRDLDPVGTEAVWPRDKSADPHITGLIIGGALWDLRAKLVADLGESAGLATTDALFASVLQRAPDITGAFLAAQIADDDDGNLGNGTPHFCAIQGAFGKHGLGGPSYLSTRVDPPVVDGTTFSVTTAVPVGTACAPVLVANVQLRYHDSLGATGTVNFAANGATWTGALPPLAANRVVYYKIVATLTDGGTITYPDNPADPEYELFTGAPTEIWCARMDEDPRWTSSADASWEWSVPSPLSVSGDPIVTHTGTHILGTKVFGDGRYPREATTSITAPEIQTWMYDQVHLQYWRWLSVEDGIYDQASVAVNGTTVWENARSGDGSRDHVDHEWRFKDIDVTKHAGTSITASWSLASDKSRELGGWNLDDVCLVGLGKHPVCGDGVVDFQEDCDDGNTDGDDGCTQYCRDEDGGCCSAGTDPRAPLVLGLGVIALLARRRRTVRG
jgi:cysteine-rich repeat protein